MKNIADVVNESRADSLPADEMAWLAHDGVHETYEEIGDNKVNCGVFERSDDAEPEKLAIFIGGIPRSHERRAQLPVINKFFGYVAAGLALNNTVGVSFNWPGIGRSPGNVLGSSIEDRSDFLVGFTHHMMRKYNVTYVSLVGASMGAYCAALAASQMPASVRQLAFLSPAAYPLPSHPISYDGGFGAEISKPWEPHDSPIHAILAETASPTLIGFCEYDDPPIPAPIQKMFQATTAINPKLEYHTIEGVYHNFRRTPEDSAGNAIDNVAVRKFGNVLIDFLNT